MISNVPLNSQCKVVKSKKGILKLISQHACYISVCSYNAAAAAAAAS